MGSHILRASFLFYAFWLRQKERARCPGKQRARGRGYNLGRRFPRTEERRRVTRRTSDVFIIAHLCKFGKRVGTYTKINSKTVYFFRCSVVYGYCVALLKPGRVAKAARVASLTCRA